MAIHDDTAEDARLEILYIGEAHAHTNYDALGVVTPYHSCKAESSRNFDGHAYLGAKTTRDLGVARVGLLAPFGDDSVAPLVSRNSEEKQGMKVFAMYIPGAHTASSVAIYERGELRLGATVDGIYDRVTVDMMAKQMDSILSVRPNAIVCDTAYPEEVYAYLLTAIPSDIDVYATISSLASVNNITPLLSRCKGVFGNVDEINHLAQNYDVSEAGIRRSLEIITSQGAEAVFATHGAKGVYARTNGKHYHMDAYPIEKMVSTHGAGDAFAAGVVYGLQQGLRVGDAMKLGLLVAALKIQAKEITARVVQEATEQKNLQVAKKQRKGNMLFKLAPQH